jgi:ABC-type polysaccharide/polyol phosphate transport system ATPase subunit
VTAVQFDQVSKRFTLHHERARTFQEVALGLFRFRRRDVTHEAFWALRDVSFTLERGRTLGVIGRNGSGKSTLLKLLAGTMRPTSGQITANGRVFGLLELAAGFHPELSGRDNVYLNGTFLGLSRAQMALRLDHIVAFAELEQFIDTPVKHYSSGMYMRLGFAIAISLDPDILVVDEVLAVGDASFRQKCFAALADLKARKKTILFVTHDASAVRRFCDEALWLDRGQVRSAGPADVVLQEYLAETATGHGEALSVAGRPVDPLESSFGPARLLAIETVDEHGMPERHFECRQSVGVRVHLEADVPVEQVAVGVAIHRADGVYLSGTSTGATGQLGRLDEGKATATCWLGELPVSAAEYTLSAALWIAGTPVHRLSQAGRFAVRPPRHDQAGLLVLKPCWTSSGALGLTEAPANLTVPTAMPATMLARDGRQDALVDPVEVVPGSLNGARALTGVIRPGRPEDQMQAEEAFRFRWRPAPARLTMGGGEDEFLGPGWYAPEDWPPIIRWTHRRASAFLTQDEWTSSIGVIMCRPRHHDEVVGGRLLVEGRVVGEFQLASPSLEPFTFSLEPVLGRKEVEISIEVDAPVPAEVIGGDGDRRVLGVAVREVWLE